MAHFFPVLRFHSKPAEFIIQFLALPWIAFPHFSNSDDWWRTVTFLSFGTWAIFLFFLIPEIPLVIKRIREIASRRPGTSTELKTVAGILLTVLVVFGGGWCLTFVANGGFYTPPRRPFTCRLWIFNSTSREIRVRVSVDERFLFSRDLPAVEPPSPGMTALGSIPHTQFEVNLEPGPARRLEIEEGFSSTRRWNFTLRRFEPFGDWVIKITPGGATLFVGMIKIYYGRHSTEPRDPRSGEILATEGQVVGGHGDLKCAAAPQSSGS